MARLHDYTRVCLIEGLARLAAEGSLYGCEVAVAIINQQIYLILRK